MDAKRIFVYCDDGRHSPKRVPVRNFKKVPAGPLMPGGSWFDLGANLTGTGQSSAGLYLVGDEVPEPGWALDGSVRNADIRSWFNLECRRRVCRGRGIEVREEKLFPVLNAWADAGKFGGSLKELAATLQEMARRCTD